MFTGWWCWSLECGLMGTDMETILEPCVNHVKKKIRKEGFRMPEDAVTRREHDEFSRRIDAENKRQNQRIDALEGEVGKATNLLVSVEKLAANMESILKEIEKQGQRLTVLESRDGKMWRKVCAYIITTVLGLLIGAIFTSMS